jgi:UDP-N-acetylglucosamine transferase subunit ALG13
MARSRQTIYFAASAGGHLDLLEELEGQLLDGAQRVWVTSDTKRGRAIGRERGRAVLLPEYGRNPARLIANVAGALRTVLGERPRVVVTSGAGVVVPFCVLARLFGARLVYIETMARILGPSRTARLLSRLARSTIVQWPELGSALPRATVCRPTLLERIRDGAPPPGTGTFVAVGTHAQPYERLLGIAERALERDVLPRPLFAQTGGASIERPGFEKADWLPRAEVEARVASAEVVVCHAGAGIIAAALRAGRRPIVLPRDPARGEHIDDHQRQLTAKLATWGLVVPISGEIGSDDVQAALRPLATPAALAAAPAAADVLRAELQLAPAGSQDPPADLVTRPR